MATSVPSSHLLAKIWSSVNSFGVVIGILAGILALSQAHDAKVSATATTAVRLDQQEKWIEQLSAAKSVQSQEITALKQRLDDMEGK